MRVGKLDEILVVSRFALEDTVVLLRLLADSSRFLPLSRLSVQEELLEKKCFAEILCMKEAMEFYHKPMRKVRGMRLLSHTMCAQLDLAASHGKDSDVKASCNELVERFAFPENGMVLPDVIQKSDRDYCRQLVYKLSRCLSKHKVGNR